MTIKAKYLSLLDNENSYLTAGQIAAARMAVKIIGEDPVTSKGLNELLHMRDSLSRPGRSVTEIGHD